jgi:hypothetical protein
VAAGGGKAVFNLCIFRTIRKRDYVVDAKWCCAALAVTGLCCFIVFWWINTNYLTIRQPSKHLTKCRALGLLEDVLIIDNPPYIQSHSLADFNVIYFAIIDKIIDHSGEKIIITGAQDRRM